MKRMNLFTAINDAMRIALETDPTAVRGMMGGVLIRAGGLGCCFITVPSLDHAIT